MSSQTRRSARSGTCLAVAAGCAVLGGCAFVPTDFSAQQGSAPLIEPDPTAPRVPPLQTRHFTLDGDHQEMLGEIQVLFSRYENTLPGIAREYDLGYEELHRANPDVDVWLPGEGTPIYLPTSTVLPDVPRTGIVINIASMRLLYFTALDDAALDDFPEKERLSVTSYPIGIGREGWATPTGAGTVTQRARDPTWYPPASVRAEHAALGDPLPGIVPPGPDNPLGAFALALSMPGYLIHGTNKPAGVGMRVSHGCIRLYPEDIEALFDAVPTETPVRIINEPVLAGWRDGQLYLEAHPALAEDQRDLLREAERVLEAAIARVGGPAVAIDAAAVARVVEEQRGMPFPVLAPGQDFTVYLAAARIVENRAPLVGSVETARNDSLQQ
jgi:L,D-transpeptidase ErfK/SrfK